MNSTSKEDTSKKKTLRSAFILHFEHAKNVRNSIPFIQKFIDVDFMANCFAKVKNNFSDKK